MLGIRLSQLRHYCDEVQSTHGIGSGGLENTVSFYRRSDDDCGGLCAFSFYQCEDEVGGLLSVDERRGGAWSSVAV